MSIEVLERGELSLPELAAEANREHDFGCEAANKALLHWMAAGDALRKAREQAEAEGYGWIQWVADNFVGSYATATAFVRLATYRHILAEHMPEIQTVAGALKYLRGLPETAPRGPRGGYTAKDPDGMKAAETRRLLAAGVTQTDVAALFGVSQITVWRWADPERARQRRAQERRHRYAREKTKAALERQAKRDLAVRKVGGSVGECYSMIRKTLQVVDRAHGSAEDREIRAALSAIISRLHKDEDEIVRALGIE